MKKYYIPLLLAMMLGIIQSSCKKDSNSPKYNSSEWKIDTTGKYPYTMTAVVTLSDKLNAGIKSGDQLGAFINGKCRGVGSLQNVGGTPVFFVLIHGEASEQQPVVFMYYSTSGGTLYYSNNALSFSIDGNFGIVDDPEVLLLKKL